MLILIFTTFFNALLAQDFYLATEVSHHRGIWSRVDTPVEIINFDSDLSTVRKIFHPSRLGVSVFNNGVREFGIYDVRSEDLIFPTRLATPEQRPTLSRGDMIQAKFNRGRTSRLYNSWVIEVFTNSKVLITKNELILKSLTEIGVDETLKRFGHHDLKVISIDEVIR